MSSTDAPTNSVQATSDKATQQPYTMPIDLKSLITKTFLSLYEVTANTKQAYPDVDYVFEIGAQRIFVFVQQQELIVIDDKISKKQVIDAHVQIAKRMFLRFEQCLEAIGQADNTASTITVNNIYIGISQLTTTIEGVQKEIAHDYGSVFYKKHFAQAYQQKLNDAPSDSQADKFSHPILQLLSLDSLRTVLRLLPTPPDFVAFLSFYRYILNQNTKYRHEVKLAPIFLVQPAFFIPALGVQRQLVAANMLDKVESRLLQACEPVQMQPTKDNSANQQSIIVKGQQGIKIREALVPKMHQYAEIYHKIVGSSIKNRYKTNKMLPLELAQLLISESMYTRLCLVEELMSYSSKSDEDKRTGYERHQHSFNVFGRHYMMIFYGTDSDTFYSQENIKREHQDLLLEINAELQNPVMQDIFILGFQLSASSDKRDSNMEVVLDIYHRKGAPLTDSEKARLKELEG